MSLPSLRTLCVVATLYSHLYAHRPLPPLLPPQHLAAFSSLLPFSFIIGSTSRAGSSGHYGDSHVSGSAFVVVVCYCSTSAPSSSSVTAL
jgi:hypothetical protein